MGQIQNCECEGFLIPDEKQIPLYTNNTTHIVAYTIQNDPANEIYYSFSITEHKNDLLKVIPFSVNDSLKKPGWIKSKNVGIYSANYNRELHLYIKPSQQSGITSTIKEYFIEPLTILACSGKWLYVQINLNSKSYKGWIAPEDQCANVYTTCN